MKLSQKLTALFDSRIRARGEAYFWRGHVRVRLGSDREVEASVQGSRTYEVSLVWKEKGVLSVNCECEYFQSAGPCKHLWATILNADERGYLGKAASAEHIRLDLVSVDYPDEFEANEADLPPSAPPLERPDSSRSNPPNWREQIALISSLSHVNPRQSISWPARREFLYLVDLHDSMNAGSLVLSLATRDWKIAGGWTRANPLPLNLEKIAQLPSPEDREIASALAGAMQYFGYPYGSSYSSSQYQGSANYLASYPLALSVLPRVLRTGRCYLRSAAGLEPLSWDDGGAWRFHLEFRRDESRRWGATGVLRRGEERMDLAAPALITRGGFVFVNGRVAPVAEDTPFDWLFHLLKNGSISVPEKDREAFLSALLTAPNPPRIDVPEELRYEEVAPPPRPCLRIRAPDPLREGGNKLRAHLTFDYEGKRVEAHDQSRGFYEPSTRRFVSRDLEAEKSARTLLEELGPRIGASYWEKAPPWELPPAKLPHVARALVEAGWHVEAEGKVFRSPKSFRLQVSSGVDWFELQGDVQYGETSARLPELLEALRRGEKMVRLGDGTYGLLPEEWLDRVGMLASMGTPENGHVRFRRSQAGLLDALLATQPEARCDAAFARVREELRQFGGVEAAPQPEGFVGRLREYQRLGLGWMHFLRRFSLGGCLADDMGVGKTAQVLALLETRRERRAAGERVGPSLVVVPRSLVFNWKQEAARFTPQLRVLDYTGRARDGADLSSADLVLTTYGTLRRDAVRLKDVEFDYLVLDEAQAIKNPGTAAAKAARLLRGEHRLALSGTPVENHLGELWSLFEFLNPGMLGTAGAFKSVDTAARNPGEQTRQLLAHALRPFILRRTKEQVAPELPSKTEQTIYCEMDSAQRKLYDQLRQHYRDSLLRRIDDNGLAKSKIQVLEALLRLRQAACHPGLIDSGRRDENSAKLDTLLQQLRMVLDEGHKALVFSQFTSLLRIVRDRLDAEGCAYEYLDGATRDRRKPVERFQNDPDCRLFLISLKAGGLGLNLTAAEYVFLLDPWWNPAVEAQAVDRAHRIGQSRPVFAYRLLTRDTVEEKVLELQKTKRDLAAAILSADNSLIRNLRREDLELLLS